MIAKRDVWPLSAVGFILVVTASWWALALWPASGAPEWLERTRSVCFNITESGLPDAKGWLLLLGQPPTMVAFLLVGWGREVRDSLRRLVATRGGLTAVATAAGLTVGGVTLAGVRVADARLPEVALTSASQSGSGTPLERPWPEAEGLVDQLGRTFTLELLEGGPSLVTFAFGHCETVCPLVVEEVRVAREALSTDAAIVVITVDPWRDTPARLAPLLRRFGLDPEKDHVVGGDVAAVQAALEAWDIRIQRDARTGDIVHPAATYLVRTDGTIAFRSGGARDEILAFAYDLGWRPQTQ